MRGVHFFKHVLLMLVIAAAIGASVMLLWNWLVPGIFGWSAINYWQAIGLFALAKILFGGFGKHWGHRHHDHSNPIREKWMKMSPEEQKEFLRKRKEQMKEHWHGHHHRRRRYDFFENCDFEDESNDPSAKENE